MGSIYSNKRNLPPPNPQDYINNEKIPKGFEEMEKIPKDQFLCPLCANIPVIKKVHTDNGHIEFICKYHGEKDYTINDYAKAMKDSMFTYFKTKCRHCNKVKGNIERKFQYCCRCKVDSCEECVNRFDFQEIDHRRNHLDFCIPVNKKNHVCLEHTYDEFLEFCIDCQENICQREKIERHRGHKKVSILNNDIANYRRMIINKNKILSDIIRFNQLLIIPYTHFIFLISRANHYKYI